MCNIPRGGPFEDLVILKKSSEIQSKFKPLKYQELRSTQRFSMNYTVFYLGLFFSLLFNYFLTLYMGQVLAWISDLTIKLLDKVGIEVHFIRLIYFTVFDVDLHERFHYPSPWNDWSLFIDLVFLLAIIMPLFVLSV